MDLFVRHASMLRTIKRPTRVDRLSAHSYPLRHRGLTVGRPEDSERREKARDESQRALDLSASVPLDVQKIREHLRKWSIKKASDLRVRMDEFSATAQAAFQRLGGRVNEVTGYNEIGTCLITTHPNSVWMFIALLCRDTQASRSGEW